MSGPRAPHSLRHEPQSTPLKFEEPVNHPIRRSSIGVQPAAMEGVLASLAWRQNAALSISIGLLTVC
jgi:hypothetical protein